jgi:hypothetical protein
MCVDTGARRVRRGPDVVRPRAEGGAEVPHRRPRHQTVDEGAGAAVALAALKDWSFIFGPELIVPFGNGLILGYLMYRSGLVPRRMAWFGLVGGPLLLIGNIGVLFDLWDQTSAVSILVAPEFIWEAFLGIYCAVWGFRTDSPILSREP